MLCAAVAEGAGMAVVKAVPTTTVGSLLEEVVAEAPAVEVSKLKAPRASVVILGAVALLQQLLRSLTSRQQYEP